MAKYRLRKSDEVFEATKWNHGSCDVNFVGSIIRLSPNVFDRFFEPVPDEPAVGPAVEKLAILIFQTDWPDKDWKTWPTDAQDRYRTNARAILDAGYTPPVAAPTIQVGSRVRYRGTKAAGEVRFIEGGIATVKWESGNYSSYSLNVLELIEEGTPRG